MRLLLNDKHEVCRQDGRRPVCTVACMLVLYSRVGCVSRKRKVQSINCWHGWKKQHRMAVKYGQRYNVRACQLVHAHVLIQSANLLCTQMDNMQTRSKARLKQTDDSTEALKHAVEELTNRHQEVQNRTLHFHPARVILTGSTAHCFQSVVDTSSAMEELRREVFAVQQQLVPLTARLEAYAHAQAACTCYLALSSR